MDTAFIDSAITAALTSAETNPEYRSASPVEGSPAGVAATVQTDAYVTLVNGEEKSGYRVTGTLTFENGAQVKRIVDIGPNSSLSESWPSDIEAVVRKHIDNSFLAAEEHLSICGFSAVRLVSLLNLYLSAVSSFGNDASALASSRPKLVSVYAWTQQVQAVALQGSGIFPPAPHKFEEVMLETAS